MKGKGSGSVDGKDAEAVNIDNKSSFDPSSDLIVIKRSTFLTFSTISTFSTFPLLAFNLALKALYKYIYIYRYINIYIYIHTYVNLCL
jgi:hypothetical protein